MPAHFIISFLGLPWPVYFFFTSFTPMGFLLDPLSFISQITTWLSLISSWAYWPLGRPIEFTNSFPGLPQPIYLFLTSFYTHGLTTSFFGLPQPVYFFFTSILLLWACQPSILPLGLPAINPTISACWACFLILVLFSLSHLFYIVGILPLLGPLSKVGINIQPPEQMDCSWNSYTNAYVNSRPRFVPFPAMNRLVSSNFPI